MKKNFLSLMCAVMAMLVSCAVFFAACTPEAGQKEYTIQYTDGAGTHILNVTDGMPYTLEEIPQKEGYTFTGLFNQETGGIQYVGANGASLAPFSGGKNLVLFPQFEVKNYTVILDYRGAAVTGGRQLTVSYGSSLPELPANLSLDHKKFSGWYTEENCGGTKVADEYGLIPVVSVLNDKNFNLSGEVVTLYAGFEAQKFTVTCYLDEDYSVTEELQVEYDTPANKIVTKTRIEDYAPFVWSKTADGEAWGGKITEDITLYAIDYAPVIDFDSDGGSEVPSVIAREGSTVSLPTPTKEMAKFAYWEDVQGKEYTSTKMPDKSITLKAVWQAKLIFDSNGGTKVEEISEKAGESIELPTPEKEGYIFAGWYTEGKDKFTSTKMPAAGLKLKAGWYTEKTDTVVVVESNNSLNSFWPKHDKPNFDRLCFTFDFSKYLSKGSNYNVIIDFNTKLKTNQSKIYNIYLDFYSQKNISSNYLIGTKTFSNIINEYKDFNFTMNFNLNDNFYMCWYSDLPRGQFYEFSIRDFYYTIHYPDTTTLYL